MVAPLAVIIALAAPSADAIRDAARDTLDDDAYQAALPAAGSTGADPLDPDAQRRRGRRRVQMGTPPRGASIGSTIMWILLLVAVALVVVVATRELGGWSGADPPAAAADAEDDDAPAVDLGTRPLGDAEALARAGRFGDAVHTLLLRTLEAVGRQTDLAPALTSREVLARVRLGGEAHGALAALVDAVEVTLFGGRPADRADYDRCVAAYGHLADQLPRGRR